MKNNKFNESDHEDNTLAKLTKKAYDLLARREQSARELGRKLARIGPGEVVEAVITDLQQAGYQSDQRFAEMLCRTRFNSGKGPLKIRMELKEHDITDDLIRAAMDPFNGEWQALAEQVRTKKFGSGQPASYNDWVKQARFLQQRGFGSEYLSGFEH